MGRGTWSWIVPDGLWEIAEPLIPPSKVRPQGGGTQDTPDETLFAAIIYALVSGCPDLVKSRCLGRTISWLTGYRRLNHRYERHLRNCLAFLGLAAGLCCYKRLARLTA